MFNLNELNLWAVAVIWFINMAVGAYWYSPVGFSNAWKKHTGIDILKIPTKQANKILASVAVSALIQALALSLIVHALNPVTILNSILIAFVLWLGFVAATTVGTTLYQKRSWRFLWLNASYFLIVMVINTLVLSRWV